jgi:replicative DNA helicase
MIAALPGLGKSTLAVQLVRGRLGLQPEVLGLPVKEGKTVLYLCMDRPEQIADLLTRAISDDELRHVGDRLVLGWGPPPHDVARRPELLAELAQAAQADTIVVDSLKDAAVKLTDDEVGATYNRARQIALAASVEVIELHHLVKRNADGKAPGSLADVYGSQHLTAGAGSVLCLVGESGDPLVKALHLKPIREHWGPATLAHDHAAGRTTVHQKADLLTLLAMQQVMTAESAARALFETEKPSRAEVERARRKLENLVTQGLAWSQPGRAGGEGGTAATRYHPHTLTELPGTPGEDDE